MSILSKSPLLIAPLYLVLPLDVQAATINFQWTATQTQQEVNTSSTIRIQPDPQVSGSNYSSTETFTNRVINGTAQQVFMSLNYDPDTEEVISTGDTVTTSTETFRKEIVSLFVWVDEMSSWVEDTNQRRETYEAINLKTTTSPMYGTRSIPEPLTLLGASAAIAFGTTFKRHKNRA